MRKQNKTGAITLNDLFIAVQKKENLYGDKEDMKDIMLMASDCNDSLKFHIIPEGLYFPNLQTGFILDKE